MREENHADGPRRHIEIAPEHTVSHSDRDALPDGTHSDSLHGTLLIVSLGLHRERIRLRHFTHFPRRRPLERLDRACLVVMQHRIELPWQRCPEIVTEALRLRPVDDPDRSPKTRLLE